MMLRSTRLAILVLSFLSVAGAWAQAPVIRNETPAGAPVTAALEELWHVGGEDDPHVFGLMIDARCDDEGNVYLLDHQLSRITVVSPDGDYLTELGGEGDGPGECRMPQTLTLFDDGTVGLGQRFPGRFIRVTRTGDPAPSIDIGGPQAAVEGFTLLISGRNRGGTLLAASLHMVPGESGQSRRSDLVRLADDGSVLTNFATHTTFLDFQEAHFVEREMVAPFIDSHAVGPDGRVYLAPSRDEYRIDVHAPDGALVHTITRAFEAPPRDRKTLDRIDALFAEQDRALPFRITWEVEPRDPAISGLAVTADGKLLVGHAASDRDLPEGIFARHDVFDAQGRWRHELHVRADADPDHDGLIFLDDGRVLLVRGLQLARLTASGNGGQVTDEDDGVWAMEIICCRLSGT